MLLEDKRYWQPAADTAYHSQVIVKMSFLMFLHSEVADQLPHFKLKYFHITLFSFIPFWITCFHSSFLFYTFCYIQHML